MKTTRRLGAALSTVVAAIAAASLASSWSCGGQDSPPEVSAGPVCAAPAALSVGPLVARPEPGWYEAPATAGGKSFTLRLELNGSTDAPLAPGSYTLGDGAEKDYATCQHCVLLLDGASEPEQAAHVFFAIAGSVTLEAVSNPAGPSSRGSLAGLRLQEVSLDPDTSETRNKTSGSCYSLDTLSWNTEPAAGAGCQRASDCGDPLVSACDTGGHCVVRQCDLDGVTPCPDGSMCLLQSDTASAGLCYRLCSPSANDCPAGLECVRLDAEASDGRCVARGTADEGADCDETPASTGCAAGLRCVRDGDGGLDALGGNPVCRRRCDFFGAASCAAGQLCAYGDYCTPVTYDTAVVDDPCELDTEPGTLCGADAQAYRGLCVPAPELNDRVVCRRACVPDGEPCPDGQYCGDVEGDSFAASVCRPLLGDEEQP